MILFTKRCLKLARLLDHLTHGGVILSIGGAGTAAMALLLSNISNPPLLALAYGFLLIFTVYRIDKILEVHEDLLNQPSRVEYITSSKNKFVLYGLPVLSYAVALALAFSANIYSFIITVVSPIWIAAYTTEFPAWLKKISGYDKIKAIPFVKTAYSATAWGMLGVSAVLFAKPTLTYALLIPFSFVFLRLLVSLIVFDMRDVVGDKKVGVNTVPVLFGLKKTQKILYVLNALSALFLLLLIFTNTIPKSAAFLLIAIALAFYYIKKSAEPKTDKIFLCNVIVDGELALWLPLSLFASTFSF